MLELLRLNLILQLFMAVQTQIGFRLAEQMTKSVVMRSVALDAGQSFRHCIVLELARFHVSLYLLVASVQAQFAGGARQESRIVGIMGSVALGAIFGRQMSFLLLPRHNDRPQFLVALLETKSAPRDVEQIFRLVSMRAVAGQALAAGSRFVDIFTGNHRFLAMALIAHQDRGSFAYLVGFFGSVRIVASQALSLRDRVVQHVSRGIHAFVARQAQRCFGRRDFELVVGARKRQVTYGALSNFKRTVQMLVFDDFGMALA